MVLDGREKPRTYKTGPGYVCLWRFFRSAGKSRDVLPEFNILASRQISLLTMKIATVY